MSVVRGRPPGLAGGILGTSRAYCSSLRACPAPKSPTKARLSAVHMTCLQQGCPLLNADPASVCPSAHPSRIGFSNGLDRVSVGRDPRPPRPSAIQRRLPLPLRDDAAVAVPLGELELAVGVDELVAEAGAGDLGAVEGADGVEEVERQLAGVLGLVALGVHVDVEPPARVAAARDAVEAEHEGGGLAE